MKEGLIGNAPMGIKGQSTLEVLIAVTILTISLTSVAVVIWSSQSLNIDSQEADQAISLGLQNIENAYARAQSNFGGLVSGSSTQAEFLIETDVQNIDVNTKRVISRVSWQTDPLRQQKIELVSLMTNWRNVAGT